MTLGCILSVCRDSLWRVSLRFSFSSEDNLVECGAFESATWSIYVSDVVAGTEEANCCSDSGREKMSTHLHWVFQVIPASFPTADRLLSFHQRPDCEWNGPTVWRPSYSFIRRGFFFMEGCISARNLMGWLFFNNIPEIRVNILFRGNYRPLTLLVFTAGS